MSRHVPSSGSMPEVSDAGRDKTIVSSVLLARTAYNPSVHTEQVLDRETLADLVLEAIEQSQRARGADAQTTWWDAAAAADLILFHVTQLAGDSPVEP